MISPIQIYIIGAGGLGKEVLWLSSFLKNQIEIIGLVDNDLNLKSIGNFKLLHELPENANAIIAIANTKHKLKLVIENEKKNTTYSSLIHPLSTLGSTVHFGHGNIICQGVIGTVDLHIGNHILINLNCTIGHNSIISDYCSIMPGVHISGNVTIGEGTMIGTGAVILPNVNIGKWCRVGAGAVVTRDVPDGKTFVGVPAKELL